MPLRRRWPWVLAVVVALLVVGAVVLVVAVTRGRDPGSVSVDDALEDFRAGATVEVTVGDTRPVAGVYTAAAEGHEKLSFQAEELPIGPTVPITVTHQGEDCFVVRADYNANHWQSWVYCLDAGGLVDTGGEVFQRFDFVVVAPESLTRSVCDPGAVLRASMQVGDRWEQFCTLSGSTSGDSTTSGPHVVVARETVMIGGSEVDTWHVRDERTYGGAQSGGGNVDTWVATETGMPVQMRWSLRIDSDSVVGTVTYTEDGAWTLESMDPRTG